MKKIDLHLSLSQFDVLVQSFGVMDTPPINSREARVARSVLNRVIIKLKKKHVDVSANRTLFSHKKKLKFSLEYHEAHYLEKFIDILEALSDTQYEKTILRGIYHDLNQKLT